MILVIKNGTVVTMDKDKKIGKYDIVVENNIIKGITRSYEGNYDKIIDATGLIIMPGLINSHMHMGMSVFRGTNDGLDLQHWLTDKIFPIEDKMTGEDIYYSTLLTLIEMIKTGTTTGADMYFKWNDVIKAIEKAKVRCIYSRCINDPDGNYDDRVRDFLDLIDYTDKNKNDLITLAVTPHSLYTCSKECLIKCKELADKYNLPIHIHFCENENEIKTIEEKFNMKPIKVLENLGYLNNKLILAHGVFLENENINLLRKNNVFISHNIMSNLNLGCGILPYKKYKDMGLNICLGTDGQGSALNNDLFKGMSFTSLVSKGMYKEPLYTNSYDILESATLKGAQAYGLDDKIGSLEVGKCADIVILDLNNTEIYPTNNLINQIVHNVSPINIKYTIINGNILMENGKLNLNINEDELKLKIDEIIKRLELNK